jgi:hypothetical protein
MLIEALGGSVHLARTVERLLIVTVFGVYLIWEARQVWCDPGRTAVARALARSSLTYVLLVSTSVQPWYFCLPVSIAVALGCRRRIARLTLAYSALALPALYLSYYLREATPGWVFLVYAFAPLATLAPEALAAWAGARAQVPAAVSVGDPRPEVRLGRLAEVGRGPADYAQPDAG